MSLAPLYDYAFEAGLNTQNISLRCKLRLRTEGFSAVRPQVTTYNKHTSLLLRTAKMFYTLSKQFCPRKVGTVPKGPTYKREEPTTKEARGFVDGRRKQLTTLRHNNRCWIFRREQMRHPESYDDGLALGPVQNFRRTRYAAMVRLPPNGSCQKRSSSLPITYRVSATVSQIITQRPTS